MLLDRVPPIEKKPHPIGPATYIGVVIVVLLTWAYVVYAEGEYQKKKQAIADFNQRIHRIKQLSVEGKCAGAEKLYDETKALRETLIKQGYYYSIYPYPREAHAIEIAECFDYAAKLKEAVSFLKRESVDDPAYYLRAAVVFDDAGESGLAEQARADAAKFR